MKRERSFGVQQSALGLAGLTVVAGFVLWIAGTRSLAQSPSTELKTPVEIDRAPAWRISKDPYDNYSGAVAVDQVRNEIVLESPEKLLVYDRLANTPPAARLMEPKRIIAGPKTEMANNCGLYVDSKTGDLYTIPNDTSDLMVVFSHEAQGDVAPQRELRVPHTVYGMAVDEEDKELFLAVGQPPAVVVFPKSAKDNDPALRILEGDHTQLAYPHGIAVDSKDKLIFVTNQTSVTQNKNGIGWARWPIPSAAGGPPLWKIPVVNSAGHKDVERINVIPGSGRFVAPSITVYPIKGNGDTPPLRVIQGPKTQLNWAMHVSVDPEHGEVFVANDTGHSILVFRVTDNGDVAPQRVLQGPRTGIANPTGVFVDTQNDELVISDMRTHKASVFRRTASGDTPPLRVIRSAPNGVLAPAFGKVIALAYDTKRDELLVPN